MPRVIDRARVRPDHVRQLHSRRAGRVVPMDRHPDNPGALEGYVWFKIGSRLGSCWVAHLKLEAGRE